jgi:hypothetical protein
MHFDQASGSAAISSLRNVTASWAAQLPDMPMSVRRHAPGKRGAARVTGSLCSGVHVGSGGIAQGSSARASGLTSADAARSTTATRWRTSAANIPHIPPYGRFASLALRPSGDLFGVRSSPQVAHSRSPREGCLWRRSLAVQGSRTAIAHSERPNRLPRAETHETDLRLYAPTGTPSSGRRRSYSARAPIASRRCG